jgi:hypothetical protein
MVANNGSRAVKDLVSSHSDNLGVESCDGTGWFREGQTGYPARYLKAYIHGDLKPHPEFVMT